MFLPDRYFSCWGIDAYVGLTADFGRSWASSSGFAYIINSLLRGVAPQSNVSLFMKKSRSCVMLWIVTLTAIPDIAAAYLDPGTGSMILQGLIALIGGTLATAAIYWRAVKRFIRRL